MYWASDRTKPTTPCFVRPYTGSMPIGPSPAIDAVAMMSPLPRSIIPGSTARAPYTTPSRLIDMMRR